MKELLGFDIGGTKCTVSLGKKEGTKINILDKVLHKTDRPVYEMIEILFTTAEKMLIDHNIATKDLNGIGISCGGPLNSKQGIILSPPNLPGWDNIPIVSLAEERFSKRTILENDANACAIAEWKFGAGRGTNNLIFLTFGTGMGAGLILNGNLYPGISGFAGEVGHLRLAEMGPVGFGKTGSFEGFCSGGGIAQLAQIKVREKLQMGEEVSFCESINDLSAITTKKVAEAAYNGDALAKEIFRLSGFYLGRGLALLIDIINPEIIVLGSIYGRAKELLEPAMTEVIEKEAYHMSRKACSIVPAQLSENLGDIAALALADICTSSSTEEKDRI